MIHSLLMVSVILLYFSSSLESALISNADEDALFSLLRKINKCSPEDFDKQMDKNTEIFNQIKYIFYNDSSQAPPPQQTYEFSPDTMARLQAMREMKIRLQVEKDETKRSHLRDEMNKLRTKTMLDRQLLLNLKLECVLLN